MVDTTSVTWPGRCHGWIQVFGFSNQECTYVGPRTKDRPSTGRMVTGAPYHDYITGRSVTGILDLLNGTPMDWYSKKQATVETATYGSEFVAAWTCVERSFDLRFTLQYLGVPVRMRAYMFGDNESVVNTPR